MSTRLEAARRDHTIARLAWSARVGYGPHHLRVSMAGDALRAACEWDGDVGQLVAAAYRLDSRLHDVWAIPPRILRARVALYLRTVRRAEAWERGERWAVATWFRDNRHPNWTAVAWRPLWTLPTCPPHDPSTTPAQRRASRRGMVSP